MANTKSIMYKLQKALQMLGIIVTISTKEFYSEDQGRFIKKYIVRREKKIIIQSCSQIEVIQELKRMYDFERNRKHDRRTKSNQEVANQN